MFVFWFIQHLEWIDLLNGTEVTMKIDYLSKIKDPKNEDLLNGIMAYPDVGKRPKKKI